MRFCAGSSLRPPRSPHAPMRISVAAISPCSVAVGARRRKSLSPASFLFASTSCSAIALTMTSFAVGASCVEPRVYRSPPCNGRRDRRQLPKADVPVLAFSGSLIVCHGRLTDWDAHPRRSRHAFVDDRILTSCAAVYARMDGWWAFAVGTTAILREKGEARLLR